MRVLSGLRALGALGASEGFPMFWRKNARACRLVVESDFPPSGVARIASHYGQPESPRIPGRGASRGPRGPLSGSRGGGGTLSTSWGTVAPLWGSRGGARGLPGWSSRAPGVELGAEAALVRSGSVRFVRPTPLRPREARLCVQNETRIAYFEVSSGFQGTLGHLLP